MSTVLEIENAIDHLQPVERAQVAAWLARKEAQDWDSQMDADSASGKLDFLFREAADERNSGQLKDWPEKMKSKATRRFWQNFENLPLHAQTLARKNYELWKQNHQHPSLHFKKMKGGENRLSIRIGDHYRAVGQIVGGTVEWVWIGTHEDYNKLIG